MTRASKDPSKTEPVPGISICPNLCIADDPETQLTSPDIHNACFRADPPHRVSLRQQVKVCLTQEFGECPIVQAETPGPLPRALQGNPRRVFLNGSWRQIVLLILSLAALLVLACFAIRFTSKPHLLPAFCTPVVPAVVLPEATETATDLPQPTAVRPSRTPEPEASPTPAAAETAAVGQTTPGPALETPFGQDRAYLVHMTVEGETLDLLAARYDTSVAVLQAVNLPPGQQGIWANLPVVVLPWQKDAAGLERMQAVWVAEKISVADLAAQYGVEEADFRQENGLLDDWVTGGRWVVMHVAP